MLTASFSQIFFRAAAVVLDYPGKKVAVYGVPFVALCDREPE
jgi:hypothetical protein